MPVQQELRGVFNGEFKGLSLGSPGGGLDPAYSPVFHNCDISPDGAVIRRGGTNYISDLTSTNRIPAWSHVIKTRRGTEFLVTVSQEKISIQLFVTVNNVPFNLATWTKGGVFKQPLEEVNFVVLSSPFDRLLLLTGNHPPVQLSFLERTLDFTCINAATQRLTANFGGNDSTMWLSTEATSTLISDFTLPQSVAVNVKRAGFDVDAPGFALALNQVRRLTINQVSWQWWAESLIWEGRDFVQSVSRLNVTDIDQNVRIPAELTTDLNQRVLDSAYIGITIITGSNYLVPGGGSYIFPTNTPQTENEWGHGNGSRYVYAANAPLNHSPFFATFGAKQAAGGVSPVFFNRSRELRFNDNRGVLWPNLHYYINGRRRNLWNVNNPPGGNVEDITILTDTFTPLRQQTLNNLTDPVTSVAYFVKNNTVANDAIIELTNTENKWLGVNARSEWYRDLGAGGVLDGTYVRAYGFGTYANYSTGAFPTIGAIHRDRLVLRNSSDSADQLLVSGTADFEVPGEFYSFYQITDALEGIPDDPFTINITSKSRERITALLSWQQNLFVFTSVSTYQVSGGEVFGPDNFTTGLVAAYGAFNQRCVVATNLTILFLNRFGVFDLLNKNNTSDYGSFERSAPVRSLFSDLVFDSRFGTLPWMSINDTTNRVYLGLPLPTENISCSLILSLNLSWNSWSTVASAVPFQTYAASQVLDWTLLTVQHPNTGNNGLIILQLGATHNLDYFLRDFTNPAFPVTRTYPFLTQPVNANNRPLKFPMPLMPLYNEFNVADTVKIGVNYVGIPPQVPTPRNYMLDDPRLRQFLQAASPSTLAPLAQVFPNVNRVYYPVPTNYSNAASNNLTLPNAVWDDGLAVGNFSGLGICYPSIYASPSFNQESLGRIKRLVNLNLTFDMRVAQAVDYYQNPAFTPFQHNSAIVFNVQNYGEDSMQIDSELIGAGAVLDAQLFDTFANLNPRYEMSIPLQGYGADYQFYVVSTGADAFKLTNYEYEANISRYSNYIRRG